METKEEKQRTKQQNKALHVLFNHLAETLNAAGLDMRETLKPGVDIPWTPETAKEYLWRPIQKAFLRKESTTELTTKEIDKVYEVLVRHLGEKHGVEMPAFPSIEEIMWSQRTGRKGKS